MSLTVAYLVQFTLDRGWLFRTVDVYYDPWSLTQQHQQSLEKVLHERLKHHVNKFVKSYKKILGGNINVRKVKAVDKPRSRAHPNNFQLGVWLADKIVRRYDRLESSMDQSLIKTKNITEDVNLTYTECLSFQDDFQD